MRRKYLQKSLVPIAYLSILAMTCLLGACAEEEKTVAVGVDAESNVATGGNLIINVNPVQ